MSKKIKKENPKIAIFEGEEIRRIAVDGEWYFSIEDVIRVLTDSVNPKRLYK
jgi:prophage antirepressor-like protein